MGSFEDFYKWLKQYRSGALIPNIEKDVEVKFVIPLFQRLGYPDECRRQEFHISSHKKSGTGEFADFVYFSEPEPSRQNERNTLIIVEAKKLDQKNLDTATKQAQAYGAKLKTPLLVVTNGFALIIIQRRPFAEDEVLIESNVEVLCEFQEARRLYDLLSFSKVRELKEILSNPIKHNQLLQHSKLLTTYPEVLSKLKQDSFEPQSKRDKNKITVTRSKVSIICELPVLFYEGSCRITFSRPLLHGMSFTLDHKAILRSLLVGLEQDFHLGLRGFLQEDKGNGNYVARLGTTTLLLTEEEASDLCSCVDEIFTEYKRVIESTEDVLQTWNYPRIETDQVSGFHMVSVPKFLWDLMLEFANTFDYSNGNSDWHIFQYARFEICVYPHADIHVILQQSIQPGDYHTHDEVQIIYHPYIGSSYGKNARTWFDEVGANGIWTITYTKYWVLNHFIPEVLEYYSDQLSNQFAKGSFQLWLRKTFQPREFKRLMFLYLKKSVQETILDAQQNTILPLSQVAKPKHLEPYIQDVSNLKSSGRITSSLVKPYFSSMMQLISNAYPNQVGYMYSKLSACTWQHSSVGESARHQFKDPSFNDFSFKVVLKCIAERIHYVELLGYETAHDLDMISRVFLASLTDEDLSFTQASLNRAISAIEPIWKEARFEQKYLSQAW